MYQTEIERKFLISGSFPRDDIGTEIIQSYICHNEDKELRIRIKDGKECTFDFKIRKNFLERYEFSYPIPIKDAWDILKYNKKSLLIEKVRYSIPYQGNIWEVDVFKNKNEGLMIAEIELNEVTSAFEKPSWVGIEITKDFRYYNSYLSKHPYQDWNNGFNTIKAPNAT